MSGSGDLLIRVAGKRPAFKKIEGAAILIHLLRFRVLTGRGIERRSGGVGG
jgi:hypothetical protein